MPTVVNSFGHTIFDNPGSFDYTQTFAKIDLIQLCACTIPVERLKQLYQIIHNENTSRRSAYNICGDLFLNIDIAQTRLLIRIIKSVLHNGNNNNDNNNNSGMPVQQYTSSSSSSGRGRSRSNSLSESSSSDTGRHNANAGLHFQVTIVPFMKNNNRDTVPGNAINEEEFYTYCDDDIII